MNQPLTGVALALSSPEHHTQPQRTIPFLLSLLDRVALITGAQRGIGLEIALAYAEAGAVVYCLDLPPQPDENWVRVKNYVDGLPDLPELLISAAGKRKKGELRYVSGDVTNQQQMWSIAQKIADEQGRLDICVANAGVLRGMDCLQWPAEDFKQLLDVNVNGVLYTAQAAGRVMERLGIRGSIILIASMSGSITNKDQAWVAYNTSKAAVVQMGRSMACELGPKGIRVNTLSPGYIYTQMTRNFLDRNPGLMESWSSQNPLGRLGRPDELRGPALWLAGDGSTFCTGSDIIVDGGHRAW
ncbi:hypothetical protein AMATHDRAFT_148726 [Amanita thiersii Skay4041]|uniref:Uncharacterized protein n=1 Tax=Amanita thiersii Skay4041 TaxID=703135 RepID=A0A2A9NMN6_9AGAR|nr:hypothetical protein AMATHDRAFT_148726 [Amanita thiersii Skay4041]